MIGGSNIKRKIQSAINNVPEYALSDIIDAVMDDWSSIFARVGYDLEVTSKDPLAIDITHTDDKLPDVSIETHNENGVWIFSGTIQFPEIEAEPGDSIRYTVDIWREAAYVLDRLLQWEFDPERYYDPGDYEEV